MRLRYLPYTLQMKRTFAISSSARSTTPAVLVEIEHEGAIGYGEASLPPYRKETAESVVSFLKTLRLSEPDGVEAFDVMLDEVERQAGLTGS